MLSRENSTPKTSEQLNNGSFLKFNAEKSKRRKTIEAGGMHLLICDTCATGRLCYESNSS